jgi:hypothetical protein
MAQHNSLAPQLGEQGGHLGVVLRVSMAAAWIEGPQCGHALAFCWGPGSQLHPANSLSAVGNRRQSSPGECMCRVCVGWGGAGGGGGRGGESVYRGCGGGWGGLRRRSKRPPRGGPAVETWAMDQGGECVHGRRPITGGPHRCTQHLAPPPTMSLPGSAMKHSLPMSAGR